MAVYVQRAQAFHSTTTKQGALSTPDFRRSTSSFSSLSSTSTASTSNPAASSSTRFSALTPTETTTKLLRRLSGRGSPVQRCQKTKFVAGSSVIPLASKRSEGEDAFFVRHTAVGVADGVGGWSEYGVDAGMYSRRLMHQASELVRRSGETDPLGLLHRAYGMMEETIGTTTACVLTLDGFQLKAANLGDSGFLLLRYCSSGLDAGWRVILRSRKQQHSFNCPFQMGTDASELPHDADVYEFACERDDLIVVATDGVWDNIFEDRILDVVARTFPNASAIRRKVDVHDTVDQMAAEIASEALRSSNSEVEDTPFAIEAREHGVAFRGGKRDDITVVIALVSNDGEDAESSLSPSVNSASDSSATGDFAGDFNLKLSLEEEDYSPALCPPSFIDDQQHSRKRDYCGSPRPRSDSW